MNKTEINIKSVDECDVCSTGYLNDKISQGVSILHSDYRVLNRMGHVFQSEVKTRLTTLKRGVQKMSFDKKKNHGLKMQDPYQPFPTFTNLYGSKICLDKVTGGLTRKGTKPCWDQARTRSLKINSRKLFYPHFRSFSTTMAYFTT